MRPSCLPGEVVHVGEFHVRAGTQDEVVSEIVEVGCREDGVRTAFALHVGGLAHMKDPETVRAYNSADVVYADGASVVVAAYAVAGKRVERAATTDIGIPVVRGMARKLARPVRIALLGGPAGLASEAGEVLEKLPEAEVGLTAHGYFSDESRVIDELWDARPDVVFVGLGAPFEMKWIQARKGQLPPALYVTCGGWFKFLAGRERRAPRFMRQAGLEWTCRILCDPRGKFRRYAYGFAHVLTAIRRGRALHGLEACGVLIHSAT